jgi:hypothetical protein
MHAKSEPTTVRESVEGSTPGEGRKKTRLRCDAPLESTHNDGPPPSGADTTESGGPGSREPGSYPMTILRSEVGGLTKQRPHDATLIVAVVGQRCTEPQRWPNLAVGVLPYAPDPSVHLSPVMAEVNVLGR